MICPKCQEELSGEQKSCEKCGWDSAADVPTLLVDRAPAVEDEASDFVDTIIESTSHSATEDEDSEKGSEEPGSPKVIGERYEVIKELGRGGFAAVFQALDKKLNRKVALKRLLSQNFADDIAEEVLSRFKNEAISIARLKHVNIVEVYDYDYDSDGYYIVMEYIDGGSLSDYVKKVGKLPPMEAIELTKGIAQGLYYAHRNKLIHRDIKPDNVMIVSDLGKAVPKIVDFGLARAGMESDISVTGYAMGTPGYMAPEQRQDAKNVDHRADIYSMGKVLYKLLTGEKPTDVMPSLIPEPEALSDIIFKCIHPKPEERYFSIDGLIKDLDNITVQESKKRDTVALILENICPFCDTSNDRDDNFCASCGRQLTINCPECDKENSIHRGFCTGCGTDMPLFKRVLETYERMCMSRDAKKWGGVMEAFANLPKNLDLPKTKGLELVDKVGQLHKDATEMIKVRDDLKTKLESSLEGNDYQSALNLITRYKEIDPEDPTIGNLPEQLRHKLFGSEFDEKLEQLFDFNRDKKLASARAEIDHLKKIQEEVLQTTDSKSDQWQERFKKLVRFEQELSENEQRLKRVESDAIEAFESHNYQKCFEFCKQAELVSIEADVCNDLRDKSIQLSEEIDEQWELAERYKNEKNWAKTDAVCGEILKLQSTHVKAGHLQAHARNKVQSRTVAKNASKVGAVIGILVVILWVISHFNNLYDQKKIEALTEYDTHFASAASYLSEAKRQVAIDEAQAQELLAYAESQIAMASGDKLAQYIGTENKESLDELTAKIDSYKKSISTAQVMYEKSMSNVRNILSEIAEKPSGDQEEIYKLYVQTLELLGGLSKEKLGSRLETKKIITATALNKQTGKSFWEFMNKLVTSAKLNADQNLASETKPYQTASAALAEAQDAIANDLYIRGGEAALKASELFAVSAEIATRSSRLQRVRDPFIARLNEFDRKLLEQYTREKHARLKQTKTLAEEAVENLDYDRAILQYENAGSLLDGAIDDLTDQMIAEGGPEPLQITRLNERKSAFTESYSAIDRTELKKLLPAKATELDELAASAEKDIADKHYVRATDGYHAGTNLITEINRNLGEIRGRIAKFDAGLKTAASLLETAFETMNESRRNEVCKQILALLTEINLLNLTAYVDVYDQKAFEDIYAQAEQLIDDPTTIYRNELEQVDNYIESAKLDLIKQKSPRENILVAFDFLKRARSKGLPDAGAKIFRIEIFTLQMAYLIGEQSAKDLAALKNLRGWTYAALDELNLSIEELENLLSLKNLRSYLMPPGLKTSDVHETSNVKVDDRTWFRVFPQSMKNTLGIELCLVPPGTFVMGNNSSKYVNEKPEHSVQLDTPFYMGRFEVLVGHYREFAQKHEDVTLFQNNDAPVSGINYVNAVRYCNWLSKRYDLTTAYACKKDNEIDSKPTDWTFVSDATGYRLATEAEWEYACKYNPNTDSDTMIDSPWFGDAGKETVLACSPAVLEANRISPNHLGLYLMRGNLSELVSDWFGEYKDKALINPIAELASGSTPRNIARGGDLRSSVTKLTATYRKRIHPDMKKPELVGIRLVLPIPLTKIHTKN